MEILEFRSKIKPGDILLVNKNEFIVKQVIKFKFDDGSYYTKCFLNDGYVFADDLTNNTYLLVYEEETDFKLPFNKNIVFKNKNFDFLFTAHAIAEDTQGEEIFKKGESERFWDYKSDDNSYLSLGIIDETNKRLDFYGKIIEPNEVCIRD